MASCRTTMIIRANTEGNYKTVLEWCDLFNKDDKIQKSGPQCSEENFSVSYDELNINQSEAVTVFKSLVYYCLANNVTNGIEMHFDVSFGDGGEEYQLLYKLENGEASEQISCFNDSEELKNDEIKDGDDKKSDKREEWHFNPEYSTPKKVQLNDGNSSLVESYRPNTVFDATGLLLKALDKNGIPHDEHTLENISTKDAYDILAGSYDPDAVKPRLKVGDFKGKNIVLSGIRKTDDKYFFHAAVKWLGGVEQSEVSPDTDYVVYNDKKEGREGKPYRIALDLNSKGEKISLIPFDDFIWLYVDPPTDNGCEKDNEETTIHEEFIIEDGILKKYAGSAREVIVPEECITIGESAFSNSDIVKVILPKGLQKIEGDGFGFCKYLEEVIIPDTVQEIGNGAFEYCGSLKRISLPQNLNILGDRAFFQCQALEEIELPPNLQKVGDWTFNFCSSLKSIIFSPDLKIIGRNGFDYCKSLYEIVLPEGLQRIENDAFSNCTSLTRIIIPESVQYIGWAFDDCKSLKEIENYSKCQILSKMCVRPVNTFSYTSKDIKLPPIKSGFLPNEDLSKLEPDEKKVALNLYLNNPERYPEDKQEIYETYIKRQGGKILLNYIKQDEYELAEKLLQYGYIKLPKLLEALNASPENSDIRQLIKNYINENFSEEELEKAKEENKKINLKKSLLTEIKKTWGYKKLANGTICITSYRGEDLDIVVPETIGEIAVTEIGNNAFTYSQSHCNNKDVRENLTNVILPDGIVKIGEFAFSSCAHLKSIKLPKSLNYIEAYAFFCCGQLEMIELPEGLLEIGNSAFGLCKSLKELTIPSTVQSIGEIIEFGNIKDVYILSKDVKFLGDAFNSDTNAFSYDTSGLTIHGLRNSTSERYAEQYGIKFKELPESYNSNIE